MSYLLFLVCFLLPLKIFLSLIYLKHFCFKTYFNNTVITKHLSIIIDYIQTRLLKSYIFIKNVFFILGGQNDRKRIRSKTQKRRSEGKS